MRMSAAELVARHRTQIASHGAVVYVMFPDAAVAAEFRQQLYCEAAEIPRSATRLVRSLSLQEGPEPHRAILELVDGDLRAHRFFVSVDDLRTLAAIPIVASGRAEPVQPVEPEHLDAERQDDLRELVHLRTRLDRAERAIRHQRQQLNSLRSAFAKRFGYATGRYPSYCCQRCGDQIGWIGRAFQAIGVPLHTCRAKLGEA